PYPQLHESHDAVPKRYGWPHRHWHVVFLVRRALRRRRRLPLQSGQSRYRRRPWHILLAVAGVGPQLGWSFTVGRVAIDLNMRASREFAAQNRLEGWNAWFTVTASRAKRRAGN